MIVSPFLVLGLPVVDLADPPPRPAPPMPIGASKMELRTGLGLVTDGGLEIDLHATGTGYVVAWSETERDSFGTTWTGLQVTYYTPADAEMMADRYWIGPLVRGGLSTELFGRHGFKPGALQRIDFDLGYRFHMENSISGAVGLGWGVVHDHVINDWYQGMKLLVEFSFR